MAVFISYSNQDEKAVQTLATDLERARQTVWLDEELHGGDTWWQTILKQIQDADIFIYALSNNSQRSKPCRAELEYARALGIPVLPVQIGPLDGLRSAAIADLQIFDYRQRNVDAAYGLMAAVQEAKTRRGPLLEPLPDPPPIPFEYLMRLGRAIDAPQMSPSEQVGVFAQLRQGLEDEDDANARRDIAMLLRNMRSRPDATYRSVREIDALLATIDQALPIQSKTPEPSSGPRFVPKPAGGFTARLTKHASPQQQPKPRDSSLASSSPTPTSTGSSPSQPTTESDSGRHPRVTPQVIVILGIVVLVLGFLLPGSILVTLGILLVVGGAIWKLVEVVVVRRRPDRRSG